MKQLQQTAASYELRPEAQAGAHPTFEIMGAEHLDRVIVIESAVYNFPWTRRNFSDALIAGYDARVLCAPQGRSNVKSNIKKILPPVLLGYFVLMIALDEAHLLNISVTKSQQHRGHGRQLLQHAIDLARERHSQSLLLEVRVSNHRAIDIYTRQGFRQIGVRKAYYPQSDLDPAVREDAMVMRRDLGAMVCSDD